MTLDRPSAAGLALLIGEGGSASTDDAAAWLVATSQTGVDPARSRDLLGRMGNSAAGLFAWELASHGHLPHEDAWIYLLDSGLPEDFVEVLTHCLRVGTDTYLGQLPKLRNLAEMEGHVSSHIDRFASLEALRKMMSQPRRPLTDYVNQLPHGWDTSGFQPEHREMLRNACEVRDRAAASGIDLNTPKAMPPRRFGDSEGAKALGDLLLEPFRTSSRASKGESVGLEGSCAAVRAGLAEFGYRVSPPHWQELLSDVTPPDHALGALASALPLGWPRQVMGYMVQRRKDPAAAADELIEGLSSESEDLIGALVQEVLMDVASSVGSAAQAGLSLRHRTNSSSQVAQAATAALAHNPYGSLDPIATDMMRLGESLKALADALEGSAA